MKELLRLEHAGGNREAGSPLQDYNMDICEGEILYIQGAYGSGIREIAAVLAGDSTLYGGRIYVDGKEMNGYSRKKILQKQFFPVSADRSMLYNLTVAENMEALREQRFMLKPYLTKKMEKKVDRFLKQEGVAAAAGSSGSLSGRQEEVKLSILKARLHGARLIILETLNSVFEGTHAQELCALIKKLCREGISFIILTSAFSRFARIADRIQFVYRGRDLKEWHGLDRDVTELLISQNPDSQPVGEQVNDAAETESQSSFLGIYDYEWESDKSIWEFLNEVRNCNPEFWKNSLQVTLPASGVSYEQGVLVIPKESGSLWFDNLSIADNLLLPISEKIAGNRYGVVRSNRSTHVINRFYETFGIEKDKKEMKELSKVQKKLFSIYRFQLFHPEVIFLESPYWGMDQEEIARIRRYLRTVGKKGCKVVCCSRSADEMKQDCGEVIRTDHAKNARTIQL